MKKSLTLLSAILLMFVFAVQNSYSQVGIGLFGGLSTPNDEMNNVYNSDQLSEQGVLGNFLREGVKSGYHIGAKLRVPLVAGLMLNGGIAWNRFPETTVSFKYNTTQEIKLSTVQDIIPVSVGLNYYIISSGIGLYGTGELAYNYNKNTVNIDKGDVSIPANLFDSPTYSRVGAGLGVGLDLNLFFALANLEAKYNFSNIIGRETGEELKSFFTLSVGIYFGSAGAR